VRALALSGSIAAVVYELGDGSRNIDLYDLARGELIGTTTGVRGGRLDFHERRHARLLGRQGQDPRP
jgi:hypothetical protein